MQIGDLVKVRATGGRILERRVVLIRGSVVGLCNEEEYQRFVAQGGVPDCIGFRAGDVVDYDGDNEGQQS